MVEKVNMSCATRLVQLACEVDKTADLLGRFYGRYRYVSTPDSCR